MNLSSHLPFEIDDVHGPVTDELEDLAVSFALESMEPDEHDAYALHLRSCDRCQGLVAEYQAVSDLLPDSLEDETASDGLKQSIISHAHGDLENAQQHQSNVPVDISETRWVPRDQTRFAWQAPAFLALAAGLVVAVVGLLVWNLNIQNNLDNQIAQTSMVQSEVESLLTNNSRRAQVVQSIATGAMVSLLPGTDAAPSATGRLVQDLQTGEVFLLVFNLPSIQPTQEYQVWHIANSTPTSAGTFAPGAEITQVVSLDREFRDAEAVGVSIEPIGGSPAPTGDIVLLGPAQ